MKTKYFLLAAAAVVFAACSNNESDNLVQHFDNVIRLSSSLGTTRAANDLLETNFAAGTKVKVQVTDKATSGAISYDAVDYTVGTSGALSVEPAQYYPASGSSVDIYAYYPSDATADFSVGTDQSGDNAYKTSDLMYASITGITKTSTDEQRKLTFNHLLSKIVVTLAKGTGMTDDEINAATVTLKDVIYKGTFTASNGAFTAAANVAANKGDIVIASNAGTTAHAAIVVPQSVAGKKLEIAIGGNTKEYSIPAETTFSVGNVYSYTVTLAKTGITVTSSIGAWTDGGNNNSQSAADKTLTY